LVSIGFAPFHHLSIYSYINILPLKKQNKCSFIDNFKKQKISRQKRQNPCIYGLPSHMVAFATDTGTEELGHAEMICAIVHQLTRDLTPEQIKEQGFADYYVDHTVGIWPQSAGGVPFNACEFQSKGDPITDLTEDMAAEQKARSTYDNILRLVKDPEVCDPIRFLRQRELVHFQRFGESLRLVQDDLNKKNFYAYNPDFDKQFCK
jgi:spore coat protein JC